METQGSRIKKIRQALNFSQDKFGEIFGITKQFVSLLEKDKVFLNNDKLVKLLLDFDVNINYLLGGKGEMFNSKSGAAQYEDVKASVMEEVRMMLRDEGIIK